MLLSEVQASLSKNTKKWLVTGAAGFIGSHIVQSLLECGQSVSGLDNFSTGSQSNLDDIRRCVTTEAFERFSFTEGDIRDSEVCLKSCQGVDVVLHQAALGSVPRSIAKPFDTHSVNITGFVQMLEAVRECGIKRFVYASSSSVYGDEATLPKEEPRIGEPLSPYALTKRVNEEYAAVYARCYGLDLVGLRYFNVFGPRQSPEGAYAAVIPRWIDAARRGEPCRIFGDGETSRDFCYVDNAVAANLLGGTLSSKEGSSLICNIACGERTSLRELANLIGQFVSENSGAKLLDPVYEDFRPGDVRHSLADISHAQRELSYNPEVQIKEGLKRTVEWFLSQSAPR